MSAGLSRFSFFPNFPGRVHNMNFIFIGWDMVENWLGMVKFDWIFSKLVEHLVGQMGGFNLWSMISIHLILSKLNKWKIYIVPSIVSKRLVGSL